MPTLTLTEVKIHPLNAPLGAVVTGLDTSQPVAPEIIWQLKQTLHEFHILIFKDQKISDEQLLNFSMYFGSLYVPPKDIKVLANEPGAIPVVVPISNVDGGYIGSKELAFHTDHHWTPYPSSGSLLYAVEVPKEGGDTYWLNLNLAYETLDRATKRRIANLQLITYNPLVKQSGIQPPKYCFDRTRSLSSRVFPHPLVRTHPDSGKKLLYLDYATEVEIVGMEPEEGSELIEELRQHLNQPRFYYQHKWSVGDIVYWDNQATLHKRDGFDPNERRVLKRVSLAGSRPF